MTLVTVRKRKYYENRIDFAPSCRGDDCDRVGAGRTSKSYKQIKHLTATASTPQDHLVLAQYFRWEAGKMKEEERYCLEMAAIHRLHPLPFDGKLPYGMQMQNHCKYFADKARDASIRAEEMAVVHERVAEQLSQPQRP